MTPFFPAMTCTGHLANFVKGGIASPPRVGILTLVDDSDFDLLQKDRFVINPTQEDNP